ncbi:hydrogenase expression/formation protein HypE [Martelella lutilitoris]|uniref:Hydrogenase expression/formation protein HypE n=1 Tax=Martelella lutilitoris TaxID=2583532 RepID=A0A5C4JL84_9HYPH|nr:hydrogenase expression/formation protein HypE [Martelella lutilitoris]TNB46255.1 hydrogenase expression/formation protein HypE [Martelella lutilitoris]
MTKTGHVEMVHGGGGRAMADLIDGLFLRYLKNPCLEQAHDAAVLRPQSGRPVLTTDGHVVSPLFFPGGDIGALSVHGTLNDLAMAGAMPVALTVSFILEEGFSLADLERIVRSMADAARAAGVPVVAGDTKVVERGKGDGVYISTTGLGIAPEGVDIGPHRVQPGQAILLSGTIGDHGCAILSKRENLGFETEICSDSAALHRLVAAMIAISPSIALLRDPTRGGLAATLNEVAHAAGVGMALEEAAIPVHQDVAAACELLGLDPLHIANEGKLVAICDAGDADALLKAMRDDPLGRQAMRIGSVVEDDAALVEMTTRFGGRRIVDWLAGEQLPRIC